MNENTETVGAQRMFAYRVLRYTPNLVRDEFARPTRNWSLIAKSAARTSFPGSP